MRAGIFVVVLQALACAHSKLPPGNELEGGEGSEDERNTVGDSRMPTSSEDLARAFDAPEPVVPQKAAASAPAAPPPPDASEMERQAFAQRLDEAKALVQKQQWADADAALASLEGEAERLGPVDVQGVLEQQVKSAAGQKVWRTVRKVADRWVLACGPERVDACRSKAIGALTKVGAQKAPEAG